MIHLEHPWLLLLLIPLALLLVYEWMKPEPSVSVPSLVPYRKASGKRFRFDGRKFVPFLCFALAGVLAIFALARPQDGREVLRSNVEGIDIMIVLDLSGSMLSYDVPASMDTSSVGHAISGGSLLDRLDTAKKEIADFIRMRPDDRIGMIRFAIGPDLVCPPTLDHAFLLAKLASLKPEPELLGTQTGITAPLVLAADSIAGSKSARKGIIVLFTDGRDNVPAPATPETASKNAADQDIRIYTVGIGSGNAYTVYPLLLGARLVPVQDDFDEPLLQKIAKIGNGKYYHAADADGMAAAMKDIDRIERTGDVRKVVVRSREWYPALAFAALCLILLGAAARWLILPKLP